MQKVLNMERLTHQADRLSVTGRGRAGLRNVVRLLGGHGATHDANFSQWAGPK